MAGLQVMFVFAVIATGVAIAAIAGFDDRDGRHNITMGRRHPYDMLLYHDSPKVESSLFSYPRVISNQECYPHWSYRSWFNITAFNVTDLIPRGNGGYVFVTGGGVGKSFLCLQLKTQWGKGYHFNVDIYGFY